MGTKLQLSNARSQEKSSEEAKNSIEQPVQVLHAKAARRRRSPSSTSATRQLSNLLQQGSQKGKGRNCQENRQRKKTNEKLSVAKSVHSVAESAKPAEKYFWRRRTSEGGLGAIQS